MTPSPQYKEGTIVRFKASEEISGEGIIRGLASTGILHFWIIEVTKWDNPPDKTIYSWSCISLPHPLIQEVEESKEAKRAKFLQLANSIGELPTGALAVPSYVNTFYCMFVRFLITELNEQQVVVKQYDDRSKIACMTVENNTWKVSHSESLDAEMLNALEEFFNNFFMIDNHDSTKIGHTVTIGGWKYDVLYHSSLTIKIKPHYCDNTFLLCFDGKHHWKFVEGQDLDILRNMPHKIEEYFDTWDAAEETSEIESSLQKEYDQHRALRSKVRE